MHWPSASAYKWSNKPKTNADGWWMVHTIVRPSCANCFNSTTTCVDVELSRPLKHQPNEKEIEAFRNGINENQLRLLYTLWTHLTSLALSTLPSTTHLVGSSKNMTGGLSNNSNAIAKRFRCPPDNSPVLVRRTSYKPIASKICWICSAVEWNGKRFILNHILYYLWCLMLARFCCCITSLSGEKNGKLTLIFFSECVRWLPIFRLAEKCIASQTVMCVCSTWSCIMYAACRRNSFKSLGRPFIVMRPLSKFVLRKMREKTESKKSNQLHCRLRKRKQFHCFRIHSSTISAAALNYLHVCTVHCARNRAWHIFFCTVSRAPCTASGRQKSLKTETVHLKRKNLMHNGLKMRHVQVFTACHFWNCPLTGTHTKREEWRHCGASIAAAPFENANGTILSHHSVLVHGFNRWSAWRMRPRLWNFSMWMKRTGNVAEHCECTWRSFYSAIEHQHLHVYRCLLIVCGCVVVPITKSYALIEINFIQLEMDRMPSNKYLWCCKWICYRFH